MIKCVSLASGSKGNSFLVQFDEFHYLIDLGISYRRLCQRLLECNLTPADINGIFITHEHIDHVFGLPQFLKKNPIPVFLTYGSAQALKGPGIPEHLFFPSPRHSRFKLGNINVTVLPTSHDAKESCAFQLCHEEGTLLHVTDTGETTSFLCQALSESDILIIESNHDETMLKNGPYPAALKARIAGQYGHLSNRQAFDLIYNYASKRLQHVFLAHLSEHNNTPNLAQTNISQLLLSGKDHLRFAAHLTFPGQLSQHVSLTQHF